jgi:hypothetical protein
MTGKCPICEEKKELFGGYKYKGQDVKLCANCIAIIAPPESKPLPKGKSLMRYTGRETYDGFDHKKSQRQRLMQQRLRLIDAKKKVHYERNPPKSAGKPVSKKSEQQKFNW